MLAHTGIMREEVNYMRYLDRLIASEVLPNAYKEWRGYRQKLTDFIEENCVAEGGCKPVLAIWGAGRSNDIDLARLERDLSWF